jgi:Predicted membrane protein (DUF2079)
MEILSTRCCLRPGLAETNNVRFHANMKFPEAWRSRLAQLSDERFYLLLLIAAAVIAAAVTTNIALSLNRNFLTIACDTAAFQNTIVNTLDGRWFRDTAYDGPNLLGLHSTFILAPLALVYAVIPSTDMLFILQVFGVWSAIIPLYLVAVTRMSRPVTAFAVAVAAMASPFFLEMAWAPFHPETWILAATLWSYLFYLRKRPIAFWISLGFALSCGEQAGLIYATLGASWFFLDDGITWRKRYGIYAMTAGLGWIALTTGVIGPFMHHPDQRNLVAYNYANWGVQSFPQLAAQVFAQPLKAVALLLNPGRWIHLAGLIGVPLFFAAWTRTTLPLLAPFCVYFLMSDQEYFLYFHAYYFQFAFLAGYLALIGFLARHPLPARKTVALLGATMLFNILSLCGTAGFYLGLDMGADTAFSETLHQTFDQIPVDAGVYAPHRYSAYLSNRENMAMGDLREPGFDFNAMIESKFSTTTVHPAQIDYIVCDLINDQCGWRQSGFNEQTSKQRADNVSKLVQSGQWQVFWNQNNVIILRRPPK